MKSETIVWKVKSFDQLSTKELYRIIQARIDVFVVEQNCPYPETDGSDTEALHIWAEADEEILGYCRVFGPHIKYDIPSIGRVLTNKDFRSKKLGKALMKIALDVVETRFNTTKVQISAQNYLLKFYEMFGFKSTGKNYLEDDILHTEMVRD